MNSSEMLNSMLVFATQKHSGQFDKGGNPYILHPLEVMQLLKTDDMELMCIALGHDLFEDCGVTWEDLKNIGMSARIISGIHALTKLPGQTYEQYKEQVKENRDAVQVKMADLEHNSDIKRIKGLRDKDFERMVRYQKFYFELREFLQSPQEEKIRFAVNGASINDHYRQYINIKQD